MRDRHHDLLERLRSGRSTAAHLACVLRRCVRTIYRDIAALRRRGYRIDAAPGPGGGYWLHPGCKPVAFPLDADQIRDLFLNLAAVVNAPEALGEALLRCLPEARAAQVRGLVDGSGSRERSFVRERRHAVERVGVLSAFERAVAYQRLVWARCDGANYAMWPHRLVRRGDAWWVRGFDRDTWKVQELPLGGIDWLKAQVRRTPRLAHAPAHQSA